MALVQSRSALRELKVLSRGPKNVCIILVPGIGTLQCDAWSICTSPWADFLAQLGQGIALYCYDHNIALDDEFTWQHILDGGRNLLTALQAMVTEFQASQPLLFICHGLGGAILKQALCIAGLLYERYSEVLNSIAGIVFLGTPHRLEGISSRQFGDRVSYILKTDAGPTLSRQSLARLRDSSLELLDLADRFSRTNLRVDMLSVFEQEVTRIRDAGPLRSKIKKIIVVDESLCKIITSTEHVVGVHLDHQQLPHMSVDGTPIDEIKTWLAAVIKVSTDTVQAQLRRDQERRSYSPSSGTSSPGTLAFNQAREALTKQVGATYITPHSEHASSTYAVFGSSKPGEIQSFLDSFSVKQADPRVPCFMMGTFARNKDFFGRQEVLANLDTCLLPSSDLLVSSQPDRVRVGLLCGMGGLGKTETAIEYAYRRKDSFDAVFWIRSEDTSKLEADLAQIAVRLGIQDPNEPDDKIINRGLALEWLNNPYKMVHDAEAVVREPASWLVIFDNADSPDILAPYRDIANSGAVLITSRSPLAKTSLSPCTASLDIFPFGQDEAGEFVQKATGIEGHLDEARQIGVRLGGLPLALAQMAGIIRLEFLSYAEFLRLYEDVHEEADVHDTVLQPLRTTARGNLSAVWALDKLSDAARAILEFSSFLDPDCIQEMILINHTAEIDLPAYPKRRGAFFAARKELIGSSVFRHNQDEREYWIHRVTRDVVRAKIDPDARRHVFSNALAVTASAWPAAAVGGHDIKLWDLSEKLYPHVISLMEAYVKYLEPAGDQVDVAFATLLNRAAWHQHERGESHGILPVLKLALDLCDHASSDDTRDLESDIRYTLSGIANETNDADGCVEHTEKFLQIRLEMAEKLGEVDERLARAYNQRGIGYIMAQDYQMGAEAFEESARLYPQIPNYTKDKRSLPLVNLGLVYWLQGRLDEASATLEMGLADREELYGYMDNQSFRTGRFLHALGNVRFSQGRIQESEDFHSRALKQYQSTIRNRHHRTADVCHKMAQHCLRKGLHDEALGFIEQGLKAWSVDAEKYAPEIARTSYLKAKTLFSSGQEEEATRVFQAATAMRRKLVGESRHHDRELKEDDFDELVTFWSR